MSQTSAISPLAPFYQKEDSGPILARLPSVVMEYGKSLLTTATASWRNKAIALVVIAIPVGGLIGGLYLLYRYTGISPFEIKSLLWSQDMKGALAPFYVPIFMLYFLERYQAP